MFRSTSNLNVVVIVETDSYETLVALGKWAGKTVGETVGKILKEGKIARVGPAKGGYWKTIDQSKG